MKNAQFAFDRSAFTTFGDMARFTIETTSAHEEEALLAFLNSGDYDYEVGAEVDFLTPELQEELIRRNQALREGKEGTIPYNSALRQLKRP